MSAKRENKMTELERVYYDAAMKIIGIDEDRSTKIANRVSQYVYEEHGYNAASDSRANDALCCALDHLF